VLSFRLLARFKGDVVTTVKRFSPAFLLILTLLLLSPSNSSAIANPQNPKVHPTQTRPLTRAEMKQAEARLTEMGYGTGRNALVAFQKYEGRKVTGQLSRNDFDAIMNASAPQAKDSGYKHVEVDLDRQVLLLTDSEGVTRKIIPVSTGSNKHYSEKGMSGMAYTPRGRFRIYAKLSGWRKSPLGLLYYPNYFSDGLAIHGNPSVPQSPQSHGCIRIPMSAAAEISRLLPLGTIVLIYDSQSFVSAKDWAEADKQQAGIR
jgi:lipoprotein-anchoring transpeptidase ErfK/SrfK